MCVRGREDRRKEERKKKSDRDFSFVHLHRSISLAHFLFFKESFLLKSLEEVDPTASRACFTQPVLSGVTKEEETIFQPKVRTQENPDSVFQSVKGTGESLWNLAAELHNAQERHPMDFPSDGAAEGGGQADRLATNAAALVTQRRESESIQAVSEHSSPHIDPKANWKILKAAMHLAESKHSATDKKTDAEEKESAQDVEAGVCGGENSPSSPAASRKTKPSKFARAKDQLVFDYHEFKSWIGLKMGGVTGYIKFVLLFLILPCTSVAALLFYVFDNPPCGTQEDCLQEQYQEFILGKNSTAPFAEFFGSNRYDGASVSWWLIFLGVRQAITFALARMTEAFVIDFLSLGTQLTRRFLGPVLALFIVQSKGWPVRLIFWGAYNFALLYGDRRFARHWLYWQDVIALFNRANPAGNVTHSKNYLKILALAMGVGAVVAVKRFYMGLTLGKSTYVRYAQDLERLMKKILLVSQIAYLARQIEKDNIAVEDLNIQADIVDGETDDLSKESPLKESMKSMRSHALLKDGEITESKKFRINELLGEWEEPEATKTAIVRKCAVLHYRSAQSCSY